MSAPSLPRNTKTLHSRRILLSLLTIFFSLAGRQFLNAQDTSSEDDGSYTIRGTVVNSVTLAPVGRALVFSRDQRYAKLTDAEGHFEFKIHRPGSIGSRGAGSFLGPVPMGGVQPSRPGIPNILFGARKPGYFDSQNEEEVAKGDSDSDGGLEIRITLVPEALIVGRVNLPANDGTEKIGVEVYRRGVQEGHGQWVSAGSGTTRANGEFRFANLRAGDYKLFTRELMDQDPLTFNPFGQMFGYPPVFFPAAADFESGGVIRLKAGETFSAALTPERRKYFPVKLGVSNAELAGGFQTTVELGGHKGPGYSLGINANDNAIVGMLPDGNYSVEVTKYGENMESGIVNFSVSGGPVIGPAVTLTPDNSIEIRVDDERTKANNSIAPGMRNLVNMMNLRLVLPDEFGSGRMPNLRPQKDPEDESLAFENVGPGSYRLRAGYNPWAYVAAASSGGVDLLRQPLVVGYGATIPAIEITIRDDGAHLRGHIENWPGQGGTRMKSSSFGTVPPVVVLLPTADGAGEFCQTWIGPGGVFDFAQVPRGEYRVIAFDHMPEELEYGNAEVMQKYEGKGEVLQLVAGQNETVRLALNNGSE